MKKFFLIALSFLAFAGTLSAADGYKVGDEAEDFNLKNIDESYVSLADYPDAKGFVVIFTCNHCPYSKAYEDRIIAIDEKYEPLGYPVIAINPNDPAVQPEDSFEKMIERARDKKFTFPYLFDEKQDVYPKYGATRTPHVFLLDKNGDKLIVEYIGAIDDNYKDASLVEEKFLENAIDALLVGENPDPNFTKAIGCTIKTKD